MYAVAGALLGHAGGLRRARRAAVLRAVGGDHGAVRQQAAGVLKDDEAVAQQAPPLLRVTGNHPSRLAARILG